MVEPSPTTLELYDRLPRYMRDDDQALPGVPLQQYLSLPGEQLDKVRVLTDRLDHYRTQRNPASPSDLTDPELADPAWLAWLAQGVGAHLSDISDVQARRDAIRYAPTGFRKGTREAIAGAARTALTGTKTVSVHPHSVSAPGDGTRWDLLIVTRYAETPSIPAVIAAIVAQRAKPAGFVLHVRAYTATWTQMETAYGPAWSSRNGKTWAQLQEAGL